MADLLIRKIPPAIKKELEARAAKSGKSLSEEAKRLLRRGLNSNPKEGLEPGETLINKIENIFSECRLPDEEISEIETVMQDYRKAPMRPMPDLE